MGADAHDHDQDTNPGNHFDETVDTKSEKGQRFIRVAKDGGDQTLSQIVYDGKPCQVDGPLVIREIAVLYRCRIHPI